MALDTKTQLNIFNDNASATIILEKTHLTYK